MIDLPPAPVPVAPAPGTAFAVSAAGVYVPQEGRRAVRLRLRPADGGAARTLVRVPGRPDADTLTVTASDERVAMTFIDVGTGRPRGVLVTGPPGGPWRTIRVRAPSFLLPPTVDGPNVAFDQARLRPFRLRSFVATPPGTVRLPRQRRFTLGLAGEFVARSSGNRVDVVRWRTGELVRSARVEDVERLAVRADGAVAMAGDDGLLRWLPGADPQRVGPATNDTQPRWAGDRIVASFARRLYVVEADGSRRRLGVPSRTLGDAQVVGEDVVWEANGCLLRAPVASGTADAPAPGPCARTEVRPRPTAGYDRRGLKLRVQCVAGPGDRCRVRLRACGSRSVRRRLVAGTTRRIAVPVRGLARGPGILVRFRLVVRDPGGRRSVLRDSAFLTRRDGAPRGRPVRHRCVF